MQSTENTEGEENPSCWHTRNANTLTKLVINAKPKRQSVITAVVGAVTCSMKPRGWRSVLNTIIKFMSTRKQQKKQDTSTTPAPFGLSRSSELPTSVDVMLAGIKFTVTQDNFQGRFHAIPLPLWEAIIGFHRAISIKYKAESVSFHRWSERDQAYHTIIPFQTTTSPGLSVRYNWGEKRNQDLLKHYFDQTGEEFLPACSIHTHVDITAFESGTDAADEESMPGWHITLGNLLNYKKYHFDFRMRLPKSRKLAHLINNKTSYPLEWRNLFVEKDGVEDFVHTVPGSTDFHKFLHRVHAS